MHKLVNNFAHHHHEIAGQGVISASNTHIRKSQILLIRTLRGKKKVSVLSRLNLEKV